MPQNDELGAIVRGLKEKMLQDLALLARRQFMARRELAEKTHRRTEIRRKINSLSARIDNLKVVPYRQPRSLELLHRDNFFKVHGIVVPPNAIIKVPDYVPPWDEERVRLLKAWYNTQGVEPANSIAARAYIIYTCGYAGLLNVWLGGGKASTGPTIFDILSFGVPASALPGGEGMMPPDLPSRYPKIEQH